MLLRIRWDLPVVGAAWALMLCATTLLAAGALYGDAVASGSLREAIGGAPPRERGIQVTTSVRTTDAAGLDGPVRAALGAVIGPLDGTIERIAVADVFTTPGGSDEATPPLIDIASYEGIEAHASVVSGRWATTGTTPLEATLSEGAAAALGLGVGDTASFVGRTNSERRADIVVVGIWRPDPADPYWIGGDIEIEGAQTVGGFTTVGPLVMSWEDLIAAGLTDRLGIEWRGTPAPGGFRPGELEATRARIAGLDLAIRAITPAGVQVRVETGLRGVLAEVGRAGLVSWSGILVLLLQFAVLAGYALVLVAGMLADRRRAETGLLRSRGASGGHLAAIATVEAVLIAASAGLLAPWLAIAAVGTIGAGGRLAGSGILEGLGVGANVVVAAGLTAVGGALALVLPILASGGPIAGVRAALARTTGRTLGQRLGLDLLLVVLAGLGLWQLRLYGAPITRTARGALGVDPLLVAAPGIGLLAGGVLAMRLLPRAAELSERLLVRGRGLVTAVAGRGVARRPLRYTRSVLLLMLAAALGTFATGYVATWERSQIDQAAFAAAAAVRVEASNGRTVPVWALGPAYRAIEGVSAAMPVDRDPLDAGRNIRGGVLLGLDPAAVPGVLVATPGDDPAVLAGLLAPLADGRPEAPGVALPDGTAAVTLVLDAAMTIDIDPSVGDPVDPRTYPGLRAGVTVLDGDGRVHRFLGATGVLTGEGQRLSVPLGSVGPAASAGPSGPLHLLGLELTVTPPRFVGSTGSLELRAVEAGPGVDGPTSPVDLAPGSPDWGWTSQFPGGGSSPYRPPAATPWLVTFGFERGDVPVPFQGTAVRFTVRIDQPQVAVLASRSFLDLAALQVGDEVVVDSLGARLRTRISGAVETFPSVDPATPFLVADGASVVLARLAAVGTVPPPDEWWLALAPGADPATVTAAVSAGPDARAEVTTRTALETALLADPVPLGVIGVLGLGSLAAMAFATIGFAIGAAVSASERLGEFGILRALGLSSGQLAMWLAAEHALLLGIGLAGGVGLGYLLAWLVLPFTTLTRSGEAAIPAPAIVVPLEGLLPVAGLAVVILVLTTLVLRRELLAVKVTDVLRGRDE